MNNRLNEYLSEVETRLRPLAPVDREQEIAEIAQHLDTLIAAREAEGQTEAAATVDAIAQFGAAHDIGKRLYQTGKHKRLPRLLDASLFFGTFYALEGMAWALCTRFANLICPSTHRIGEAAFDFRHIPLNWLLGSVTLAMIVSRCGWQGVKRKAFGSASPVSAGIRWMILSFVLGLVLPYWVSCAFVLPPTVSMLNMFGSAAVFSAVFRLGTTWLSAYLVGRSNQRAGSVANMLGLAGLVEAVWWMMVWAYQFVPAPWHYAQPAGFASLLPFFCVIVFSFAVNFFIVRFLVQLGEKSRLLYRAKQIA